MPVVPLFRRPVVEREKGGVKLFVGRLPREALSALDPPPGPLPTLSPWPSGRPGEVTHKQLRACFEECGEASMLGFLPSSGGDLL